MVAAFGIPGLGSLAEVNLHHLFFLSEEDIDHVSHFLPDAAGRDPETSYLI